jgi:hypothetical protein
MPTTDRRKENMRMNFKFETGLDGRHVATVAFTLFALLLAGYPRAGLAQTSSQQTFPSANDAITALVAAVETDDHQAITNILGAGKNLASLDDDLENKVDRQLFVQKYREMHRLVPARDGTTVLYLGAENWPFPVPLASTGGAWYFDSTAGEREVLFRRIGENEGAAVDACHTLAMAENQRQTRPGLDDSATQYSDAPSPIRALLANTGNGGQAIQNRDPVSFRGYYFRILTKQGKNGPGNARSDISDRKATSRFAFIAYPMEYRSSGVMTFIVNQGDVVYEKDLGPNTTKIASMMTQYNPNSTWEAAQ